MLNKILVIPDEIGSQQIALDKAISIIQEKGYLGCLVISLKKSIDNWHRYGATL